MIVLKCLSPQEAKGLKLTVDCHYYPMDLPPPEGNVYLSLSFLRPLNIVPHARSTKFWKSFSQRVLRQFQNKVNILTETVLLPHLGEVHLIHFTLGFLPSKGAERRLDYLCPQLWLDHKLI